MSFVYLKIISSKVLLNNCLGINLCLISRVDTWLIITFLKKMVFWHFAESFFFKLTPRRFGISYKVVLKIFQSNYFEIF